MYSIFKPKTHVSTAAYASLGVKKSHLAAVFAILTTLILCAFLLVVAPAQAQAKSYSMPEVNITADAQSDGSLHVVEQRTFDFHGSYTAVYWFLKNVPSNGGVQVNSVSIQYASEGQDIQNSGNGGELENLSSVPFNTDWRDSGGPGSDSYSVDNGQNAVYVFMHAQDQQVVVQLDYTARNGVQAYQDCADLYWQFIGPEWSEPSENVTCTITLPVPSGVESVPGQNVYAWGHGPASGNVSFNSNATVVTYKADRVNSGQFAEAHIAFPVGWLTNIDSTALQAHGNERHLDTVLTDERHWADAQHNQQVNSLIFLVVLGVISIALIGWGFFEFLRHGKEHKPTFTEEYWRDVPDKDLHPAVIGRLYRWDKENGNDLVATIMHLSVIGALEIHKGTHQQERLIGTKETTEYFVVKTQNADQVINNRVDRAAMDMLFTKFSGGKDQLWLSGIKKFGESNPTEYNNTMMNWQGQLTAAVNAADLFEEEGVRWQNILITVAMIYGVIGVVMAYATSNWWPLIFMIPTAVAVFIISNFMPRRSQKGCDDYARCQALRKWLLDFSNLKERPPMDVKVWGELMIYAYLFGIADKVIKELRGTVPELFNEQEPADASGFWVPWYAAYTPVVGFDLGSSFADALNQSLINTANTASNAGGFFSGVNSGGFGGGFSGGGGGGFGGGGGGAR